MTPYYVDDHVTLYHGDCREILPALDLVDAVVVTDPPFGISDKPNLIPGRYGRRKGAAAEWHKPSTWDTEVPDLSFLPPVPVAMFGHWRHRSEVDATMVTPIRCEIVWAKDTHVGPPCPVARRDERIWVFSPEGITPTRFETSVWDHPIIPTWAHRHHRNEKPLTLMTRLITWLSADGVVVDPFAGSGTTLRAAKDLGRRAIGIELDADHCETVVRRLAQEVLPL